MIWWQTEKICRMAFEEHSLSFANWQLILLWLFCLLVRKKYGIKLSIASNLQICKIIDQIHVPVACLGMHIRVKCSFIYITRLYGQTGQLGSLQSGFLNFNIVEICMSKNLSITYFYSSQIKISWLFRCPPGPVILNYNFSVWTWHLETLWTELIGEEELNPDATF